MGEPAATPVEPLRGEAIQIEPLRIERVFDDPERVIARIEAGAPYPTLAKFHGMGGSDALYGGPVLPWFRSSFQDELFLHNPSWIDGARRAFGARIVRPRGCILNIQPAGPAGAVHVDLPVFRGSHRWPQHVWLLMSMSHSGLFAPWMVPIASGLAWFYRGEGGEFEYWADGVDRPPQREVPPLWNVGQISDNEYMWHRVGAIGRPDAMLAPGVLRSDDELHHLEGGWEIRRGDQRIARYAADRLRISLLWKAYVFRDERALASFESHDADLDIAQVVAIFQRDLARRGIPSAEPSDPLRDRAWQQQIVASYPPAFRID